METTLIGATAAKLMDGIEDREGELVAVAVVVVIDEDEGEAARRGGRMTAYRDRLIQATKDAKKTTTSSSTAQKQSGKSAKKR